MNYRKISIVVPVYNEEQTIAEVYSRLKMAKVAGLEKEIIIVDDCSTDKTRQFLESQSDSDLKIIYHGRNEGKGAALVTGFGRATGDLVVIQDADLEYDPAELESLIRPFLQQSAAVVYGSRYLAAAAGLNFWHSLANKMFTKFSNLFSGQSLTDIMTCYKAFDKKILDQVKLKSKRFGFEPEVSIKISRMGIQIREVPISYSPRSRKQGKHMNLKGQTETLLALLWYGLIRK